MGITRGELSKLIAAGVVRGCRLSKNGRLFFYREHIGEAIVHPPQTPSKESPMAGRAAIEKEVRSPNGFK